MNSSENRVTKLWSPKEQTLNILFNQLRIPYLGWKSLRAPEDKELKNRHWELKVILVL